ncbi:hypothetical protein B0J11DRAFT_31476 [Dendryphion nanum]|uniref:polynucleotide adenylyltransferase n=1 Tax=Dendryphion nanum TaxID=256645 RepID=A0A9P9EK50_9PLEO|nr:hypothetical protein B0J11DRAFT_31476 [Dendryphion nanum]
MAGDSYRPPPRAPREPRQKAPSLADRVTFTGGSGDSYRPSRSLPDFSFTSNHPAPRFPPAKPLPINATPSRKKSRGGGRGGKHNNPRPQDRGLGQSGGTQQNINGNDIGKRPWRPYPFRGHAAHDRQLLRRQETNGPEQTLGVAQGVNKFINPDDLSTSEGEMELEGNEDSNDSAIHKSARIQPVTQVDGDSVPKWSNPDPYTVLPPPAETTGKRVDFVQLIRRAKAQTSDEALGRNAVAANDDFISFDTEPTPPTGPRSQIVPPFGRIHPLPPQPPPLLEGSLNQVAINHTPALTNYSMDNPLAAGLPAKPQHSGRQQKRKHGLIESNLVSEWMAKPNQNQTPWSFNKKYLGRISENKGSDFERMVMIRLNNEIVDFIEAYQPDDHTDKVRSNLVKRISDALAHMPNLLPRGSIECFGSFPAGLYLPTADMDLVYVSDAHKRGGLRQLNLESRKMANRILRGAANKLERDRIAREVVVISKAKVPIIKFKDRHTNIHVDLSFENLTGIDAQKQFLRWKKEFGNEMIYLVAFVKQFLVMRGLSDVHTGGLGGFSTICLVVVFLHHFRQENGTEHTAPVHGKQLLDFLDFYGNKFDLSRQRLVMDPIQLAPKGRDGIDGRAEKNDRLSIQDPNDPTNNISGGSSRVKEIFKLFSAAHHDLTARCASWDPSGASILGSVIGGNYDSYHNFRNHLARC